MVYNFTISKDGYLPKKVNEDIRKELLSLAEKHVTLTIQKYRKVRSNDQLRYWFGGIVKPFGLKYGYDKDMAHYENFYNYLRHRVWLAGKVADRCGDIARCNPHFLNAEDCRWDKGCN